MSRLQTDMFGFPVRVPDYPPVYNVVSNARPFGISKMKIDRTSRAFQTAETGSIARVRVRR